MRSPAPLSNRSVFLVYFAINIEVEVLLFYYHPSMAKRFFYISLLPVLGIYINKLLYVVDLHWSSILLQ